MIQERLRQGVYVKDVAAELGVHPQTVSRARKRGAAPAGRRSVARSSKLNTSWGEAKLRFGSPARQVTFEWMRAVLQKEITSEALRRELGDIPDLDLLQGYLYNDRLSQRNRAMVILASHRGFRSCHISSFLAISPRTCERYQRLYKCA